MVNIINNIVNAVSHSAANSVASSPRSETVLECNYEENCTPLYEAIEAANNDADYAKLLSFLETGKWIGNSYSSKETPAVQAKTWVTRFDAVDEKKVKWSQLPIHLAIVCGAPISIIKALIKLYPKALRCTDDQHMLPLHLALRQGASDEVVAFILKEFPDAVYAKGKNNRSPVDCALRAKDKNRGTILDIFIERTKKRISSKLIEERGTLKNMVESKNTALESLKTEIAVQQALVGSLRQDLARARNESENIREKQAATESAFISKINDFENCHTELEEEVKVVTGKLRDEKLVETLELQVKIEKLENDNLKLERLQLKARESEAALRQELDNIIEKVIRTSSNGGWVKVQQDVEALKAKRLQMGLVKAKDDIVFLKKELAKSLDDDRSVGNKSLASIKKSVDKLQLIEKSVKTSEDLKALQTEVESLKDQLKNLTESSKTKDELTVMKMAIEAELRSSAGKTQEELDALKAAVKLLNDNELQTKTAAELARVKSDLQGLKNIIAEKQLESITKKDLDTLSESILSAMNTADANSLVQLNNLKSKIDTINSKLSASTTKNEMIAFKKEIDAVKEELKAIEISSKIQEEAAILKRSVEEELQKSQGMTQQELILMKQSLQVLVTKGLENKDAVELSKVKSELGAVKANLKSIEEASKTQVELAVLKKALEYEIQSSVGKTAKELSDMKKAVDAINMESKESKKLKMVLSDEIKQAHSKTEKDLLEMKKALDKLDVGKLETKNVREWNAVRKELESMKMEFQEKQVMEMSAAEQELVAMKKVIEAIKAQEMKSSTDLAALREEVNKMKAELVDGTTSEWKMRKAIEALKNEARAERGLPPKKDKAGLKKFLSNRFGRHSGGSVARSKPSMSYDSFDDSLLGGDERSCATKNSEPDSTPILPPSLSNTDNCDVNDNDTMLDTIEGSLDSNINVQVTKSMTYTEANGDVEVESVKMNNSSIVA